MSDDPRLRVLLVSPTPGGGQPGRWLARATDLAGRVVDWTAGTEDVGCDVVWVDAPSLDLPPGLPDAVATNPRAGVLLTRGACRLVASLGIGPEPSERTDTEWRDAADDLHLFESFTDFPHIRGHCPMRRHPLFDGLGNGSFTWWPAEGEPFVRLAWKWPDWPGDIDVIAVERSYIHVNPDRATIWRHTRPDAPPVLCIGAYLPFESRDLTFRSRLERLARNALHHAAHPALDGEPLWRRRAPATFEETMLPAPAPLPGTESLPPFDGPSLAGTPEEDSPFTLAGRRALVAGGEARGIDEIWIHPLRVLSDLRVADAATTAVRITPVGIERTLRVHGATVAERILAAHDGAAALVEWTADTAVPLDVSFRSDLRLVWPYPGGCLSPLRWRRGDHGLTIAGSGGDDGATFTWSRAPHAWEVSDASTPDTPVVACRARIDADPREPVRLSVTARVDGEAGGEPDLSPVRLAKRRSAALHALFDDRLSITCPAEPALEEALRWAAYRLDSVKVHTPSLGTGLVAGYWRSGEGWGDGRPGYAWYFGRDAAWTAFGALAVGDFEAAAITLRFLGRHQDLSGKILHECTTSGVVHYDAADSTTLYLLLAARYLAWTGDQALIREEWPYVRRAFEYALGTDRDGDGLVENTRVGHGWIEFGRLGGGTVTHYNAAIWTAALTELADTARVAGEPELATRLVALAIRARRALERTFYDEARSAYALKVTRRDDGGWDGMWTQTAMQAVPLLLGMARADGMRKWLDDVAGDAFSAPWGVRMVPATDPHYDPKSYHGGAVWPLYTGWVSWAEYAAGHARAAFRHWRMNMHIAFERAKGAWDEVLHGDEHRSAGVCPDQAWSTALAVAPLVYGLLGVEPDALRGRLRLAPQIPDAWPAFSVERLRIGAARIAFRYTREGDVHRFRLSSSAGGIRVTFQPGLPSPASAVRVNGAPVPFTVEPFGERHRVSVDVALDGPATVEVTA